MADIETFELTPRGLGFVDKAVEADYRAWALNRSVPFTRIGMINSIVAWSAVLGAVGVLFPDKFVSAASIVIALPMPFIVATLVLTWLPKRRAWLPLMTALSNTLAGVAGVFITYTHLPLRGGIMAAVTIVAFFAFTIFQIPARHAALAVLPYVVFGQVELIRSANVSGEGGQAGFESMTIWMTTVIGFLASVVLERTRREAFRNERISEVQRGIIERERTRADDLLHSILPAKIADRLKTSSEVIAQRFDSVTVLFADVAGFTPLSARLSPERIVEILNAIFTEFDALAAKHGVEKIKTIGDAYMAAAGLPEPRPDHVVAIATLALEMREVVARVSQTIGEPIQLRIGVCTGPVVAGVIGKRKFAYDLWGDTVNTAARMESHGLVDAIQLTEAAAKALPPEFTLEERGVVEVKGKGPMKTWLLRGRTGADRTPLQTA